MNKQGLKKILDSEPKTAMVEANTFPQQIQSLEDLIQQVKLKIAGLESSRKNFGTTSAADAVAILLYLSEIQNQQVFLSNMQKELS